MPRTKRERLIEYTRLRNTLEGRECHAEQAAYKPALQKPPTQGPNHPGGVPLAVQRGTVSSSEVDAAVAMQLMRVSDSQTQERQESSVGPSLR